MRLPLIKQLVNDDFDEDYMEEAVEVLLSLSQSRGITENEVNVIGELISNIEGAREVMIDVKHNGGTKSNAINRFLSKVVASIK